MFLQRKFCVQKLHHGSSLPVLHLPISICLCSKADNSTSHLQWFEPIHPACRSSIKVSTIPLSRVLRLDVYPSVFPSKKPPLSSVNKCLIFQLHVPVCLCVFLTRRQLSQRSRVAVSQVLVSVLLSIHLPVTFSQIKRVNLPPAFPPSPGWLYKKINKEADTLVYSEE